jgi:hypothetical protein
MIRHAMISTLLLTALIGATACSTTGRKVASVEAEAAAPVSQLLECTPVISDHYRMAEMKVRVDIDGENRRMSGMVLSLRTTEGREGRRRAIRELAFAGELTTPEDGEGAEAVVTPLDRESPVQFLNLSANYPAISSVVLKNGQDFLMSCRSSD